MLTTNLLRFRPVVRLLEQVPKLTGSRQLMDNHRRSRSQSPNPIRSQTPTPCESGIELVRLLRRLQGAMIVAAKEKARRRMCSNFALSP